MQPANNRRRRRYVGVSSPNISPDPRSSDGDHRWPDLPSGKVLESDVLLPFTTQTKEPAGPCGRWVTAAPMRWWRRRAVTRTPAEAANLPDRWMGRAFWDFSTFSRSPAGSAVIPGELWTLFAVNFQPRFLPEMLPEFFGTDNRSPKIC